MTVRPEGCPLSRSELEVIESLGEGKSVKTIARERCRNESTIKSLLMNARKRIGVKGNSLALLNECYKRGWLGEERDLELRERVLRDRENELDEWPSITPAQRLYLQAFDRMLLAPFGSHAEQRARGEMSHMLDAMRIERRLPVDLPFSA